MKPSYKIWAMVAATLVVLRFTITLRTGVISGDDTFLLVRCFGWWHDGDFLPLLSSSGSKGFLYVGLHNFAWAVLAGLCNFRLGPLFVVHAVLMVTPALLLGWQLRGRSEARWAVLLGLSSPLMAYFSLQLLPLWWIASFGGIVALQVAAREDQGKPVGPLGLLLVGLIGGYMCSVYPSLSPLTLGLFFWLLFKRKTRYAQGAYLAGCVAGYAPCAVLLVSRWAELNPQPVVTQAPLAWAPLLGGIFRYIGTPSVDFMNSPGVWMARENNLRTVTVAVWLLLFVAWIFAMIRAQRAGRLLPGSVLLAACSFAVFIPFTLITRTESWYHQAVNLWWIPILIVPWSVQELVPRQARVVLATLVGFNLAGLLLIFGPRLLVGTQAEGRYEPASGPGPTWWMQERIADEIANRAREELAAGDLTPLAVRCEAINLLPHSLPRLFHLQHPELDRKVGWVPEGARTCTLLVAQAPGHPHRLRLFDWTKTWPLPAQPYRRMVRVLIPGGAKLSGQIAIELKPTDPVPMVILDAEGVRLPFWIEPELPAVAPRRVWVRIPPIPAGTTRFFLYYGGPASGEGWRPEEVFEAFEGFDGAFPDWVKTGPAVWQAAGGIASVESPVDKYHEPFSTVLRSGKITGDMVLEARVRYRTYPTPNDIGLIFSAAADGSGYMGYLHGQGAVYLGAITSQNTVDTIGGNNWIWKQLKARRWMILRVDWRAPLVRVLVDEREIVRGALIEAAADGRVGLGVRRGSGQPAIELDWFRVRRAYATEPGVWQGETETRPAPTP